MDTAIVKSMFTGFAQKNIFDEILPASVSILMFVCISISCLTSIDIFVATIASLISTNFIMSFSSFNLWCFY
jgi:hypothetical protein